MSGKGAAASSVVNAPIYPAYCFPAAPTYKKWVKLTAADIQALHEEPGFEGQNLFFHLNHPIEYVYVVGPVVAVDHLVTRYNTRFSVLEIDDGSGVCLEIKISYKAPPKPSANTSKHKPSIQVQDHTSRAVNDDADNSSSEDDSDNGIENETETKSLINASASSNWPQRSIASYITTRLTETTVSGLTVASGPHGTDLQLNGSPIDVGTVLKAKGTLRRFRNALQLELRRAFIVPTLAAETRVWQDYADFVTQVLARPWELPAADVQRMALEEETRVERERAQDQAKRQRVRERAEKLRAWEGRRAQRERKAEQRRLREALEMDGNALDRPGWKPAPPTRPLEPIKTRAAAGAALAPTQGRTVRVRSADVAVAAVSNAQDTSALQSNAEATAGPGASDRGKENPSEGITTARALWLLEQAQEQRREARRKLNPNVPARWQHEYSNFDPG